MSGTYQVIGRYEGLYGRLVYSLTEFDRYGTAERYAHRLSARTGAVIVVAPRGSDAD